MSLQLIKIFGTVLFIFFAFVLRESAVFGAEQGENKPKTAVDGEVVFKLKESQDIFVMKTSSKERDILISRLKEDPDVLVAQPNYIYRFAVESNDSHFGRQPHLVRIKAPQAWEVTTGEDDVIGAFVDSGIDIDHDDIKANLWVNPKETNGNLIDDDGNGLTDDIYGWDFIDDVPNVKPKVDSDSLFEGVNHGTVVAGIAAAVGNNQIGVTGVVWKGRIMVLRALNSKGEGTTSTVVKAINYAIKNQAHVLNFSFVGPETDELFSQAIENAYNSGLNIVAAAGNDGIASFPLGGDLDFIRSYPVCNDGKLGEDYVIGVVSVDDQDAKSEFSNFGSSCVDISAPGENIMSTQVHEPQLGGEYIYRYRNGWDGTSMAAPQITGAVMLLRSLSKSLTNAEVVSILKSTADNIDDANPFYRGELGAGRLNLHRAVLEAKLYLAKKVGLTGKSKAQHIIAAAEGAGGTGEVKIFDEYGTLINSFFPFGPRFRGGISLAVGDLDGDNSRELVATPLTAGAGELRIFDKNLNLVSSFFSYGDKFYGSVNVEIADLDGDSNSEIIVAPSSRGGPHVRVFDISGRLLGQFFAFPKKERLSLVLGSIDLGQDGRREIIVSTLRKGRSEIRVFNLLGKKVFELLPRAEEIKADFFVSGADVDGNGSEEFILGYGQGAMPYVKILSETGRQMKKWLSYPRGYKGGVEVSSFDSNGDGQYEIVVGPKKGGGPIIRVMNKDGVVVSEWFAFDPRRRRGLNIAAF